MIMLKFFPIYLVIAQLREMFANLLASAMNSDVSNDVHPSFVEIIKQLSPDEAKILKYFSDNPGWNKIFDKGYESEDDMVYHFKNDFCEMIKGHITFPELANSYYDNLIRLMIIEIVNECRIYDELSLPDHEHPVDDRTGSSHVGNVGINMSDVKIYASLATTFFGDQFIEICIKCDETG